MLIFQKLEAFFASFRSFLLFLQIAAQDLIFIFRQFSFFVVFM